MVGVTLGEPPAERFAKKPGNQEIKKPENNGQGGAGMLLSTVFERLHPKSGEAARGSISPDNKPSADGADAAILNKHHPMPT